MRAKACRRSPADDQGMSLQICTGIAFAHATPGNCKNHDCSNVIKVHSADLLVVVKHVETASIRKSSLPVAPVAPSCYIWLCLIGQMFVMSSTVQILPTAHTCERLLLHQPSTQPGPRTCSTLDKVAQVMGAWASLEQHANVNTSAIMLMNGYSIKASCMTGLQCRWCLLSALQSWWQYNSNSLVQEQHLPPMMPKPHASCCHMYTSLVTWGYGHTACFIVYDNAHAAWHSEDGVAFGNGLYSK